MVSFFQPLTNKFFEDIETRLYCLHSTFSNETQADYFEPIKTFTTSDRIFRIAPYLDRLWYLF